ncbi:MAG: hypothetical protein DME65_14270 [Verrucomicrobia bacterium]|nr:MAG: hypothetical protein DME65_14270 [Verrucomicrobiota bacterium]
MQNHGGTGLPQPSRRLTVARLQSSFYLFRRTTRHSFIFSSEVGFHIEELVTLGEAKNLRFVSLRTLSMKPEMFRFAQHDNHKKVVTAHLSARV